MLRLGLSFWKQIPHKWLRWFHGSLRMLNFHFKAQKCINLETQMTNLTQLHIAFSSLSSPVLAALGQTCFPQEPQEYHQYVELDK